MDQIVAMEEEIHLHENFALVDEVQPMKMDDKSQVVVEVAKCNHEEEEAQTVVRGSVCDHVEYCNETLEVAAAEDGKNHDAIDASVDYSVAAMLEAQL